LKPASVEPAAKPLPAADAATPVAAAVPVDKKLPLLFFSKRYKLTQCLGKGGKATVYKAFDKVLDIHVALKLLPDLSSLDARTVRLIKQEAVLAMQLAHENIVRLYDVGFEGPRLFFIMEYVEGENFREILNRMGRLHPSTVMAVARSCAEAVEYAHRHGVIHGDLKPENLMVNKASVLRIVDFGTAMRMHSKVGDGEEVEGTPGYMSPEQLLGESVDRRTDVFSLGVVLAELLTGQPVYQFDGDTNKLLDARPNLGTDLPPAVLEVLHRALTRFREDRWPTVAAFYEAFAKATENGYAR